MADIGNAQRCILFYPGKLEWMPKCLSSINLFYEWQISVFMNEDFQLCFSMCMYNGEYPERDSVKFQLKNKPKKTLIYKFGKCLNLTNFELNNAVAEPRGVHSTSPHFWPFGPHTPNKIKVEYPLPLVLIPFKFAGFQNLRIGPEKWYPWLIQICY